MRISNKAPDWIGHLGLLSGLVLLIDVGRSIERRLKKGTDFTAAKIQKETLPMTEECSSKLRGQPYREADPARGSHWNHPGASRHPS